MATTLQNNAYLKFELFSITEWKLQDYVDNLSLTHKGDEVKDLFENDFENLKNMVLELEYNYIIGCSEDDLKDIYNV